MSCTWTSSLTVCVVNLTLKLLLVRHVAYREAFTQTVQARGYFKRQSGGKGQYGDVWLNSHQTKKALDLNSKTLSLVALCHVNISHQLKLV